MNRRTNARPPGQIRQSQLLNTFGPGAMLDLPMHSVLVGGLDHWLQRGEEINEPRLLEKLKRCFTPPLERLQLFAPPPEKEDPTAPKTGITAWIFPEWFITQDVEDSEPASAMRSRLLVPLKALTRGKFIDRDKHRRPVVPVRFVRACRRGHIGDIDWYAFVHGGTPPHKQQLYIDERGTSGDLSEVWVRCECGQQRPMSDAAKMERQSLGHCDGSRPWLGPLTKEQCGEPSRLLVRTASNAYFPQILSVISLPEQNEALVQAVNQVWEHYLANVEEIDDLKYHRKKTPAVKAALENLADDEVFQYIQGRKAGGFFTPNKSVKQVEIETLSGCQEGIGNDRPEGLFYARALPKTAWDKPWMKDVQKVVLVHRLREVIAQVGFTRFESSVPDVEGELEMGVQAASLAREVAWLPAVENRGEGVFIQFRREAIEAWHQKPAVRKRGKQLLHGFDSWKSEHHQSKRDFSGLPYIMLHSLSHLLITAMSLECGYPASSIRERVYAGSAGYGILLYTGSPDAEGTLGGLVEAGRKIAHHLKEALDRGGLCSNDPVCAQHEPPNPHERRFLLGAACHGCLLIAETCCEQKNDFLDRALVVPTVENLGAEFFELEVR
jgi:hypothetical protein